MVIICQILGGLLAVIAVGVLCSDWNLALLILLGVLFFVFELPILYLVALRKLVVERKNYISEVNSAKATSQH